MDQKVERISGISRASLWIALLDSVVLDQVCLSLLSVATKIGEPSNGRCSDEHQWLPNFASGPGLAIFDHFTPLYPISFPAFTRVLSFTKDMRRDSTAVELQH